MMLAKLNLNVEPYIAVVIGRAAPLRMPSPLEGPKTEFLPIFYFIPPSSTVGLCIDTFKVQVPRKSESAQ